MFSFSASIIIINIVVISLSVIKLDIIDGAFFNNYTVDKSKRLSH